MPVFAFFCFVRFSSLPIVVSLGYLNKSQIDLVFVLQ